MYLFDRDITSWEKWGKTFQNIDAFSQLIKHIFKTEGLPLMGIENTTPGTNAVFLCGQFVVKIYAPKQTGIPESEYRSELEALRRAAMQGVPVPKIFASGYVEDKYGFYYMITERAQGREARKILPEYSYDEKFRFVQQLNGALNSMNTRAPFSGERLKSHALNNEKWDIFSLETKLQIREAIESIKFPDMVYVHGDLTGENIIINRDEMNILDFGECPARSFLLRIPAYRFRFVRPRPGIYEDISSGKEGFRGQSFPRHTAS